MKNCPECWSEMPEQASVCAACGRRILGKPCPQCAETCKENAIKCPFCGHDFARDDRIATIEPFQTRAARLPTFLMRGRFIPQEIHLNPEKIVIKTWGLFGLTCRDEEIPWAKVAGYHYRSGIFWDQIEIQTRGQEANQIGCLPKSKGHQVRNLLEQMKE